MRGKFDVMAAGLQQIVGLRQTIITDQGRSGTAEIGPAAWDAPKLALVDNQSNSPQVSDDVLVHARVSDGSGKSSAMRASPVTPVTRTGDMLSHARDSACDIKSPADKSRQLSCVPASAQRTAHCRGNPYHSPVTP